MYICNTDYALSIKTVYLIELFLRCKNNSTTIQSSSIFNSC